MNMELSGRGKPSPDKSHRVLTRDKTDHDSVGIGLNAAIVAVLDNEPVALVVRKDPDSAGATDMLPFGPFSPREHRT
ncbi:MAG: NAD regulator, partial [Hyphomicrobium sp.]